FQQTLFIVSFLVRFCASVAIYQLGLLSVLGDEDSSGWLGGEIIASHWQSQHVDFLHLPFSLLQSFNGHHLGYQYLVAFLFYLMPEMNRLVPAALNCLVGSLTVVLAFRIAKQLFGDWVANRVGWWSCIVPSLVVWSAQTLKEPWVIFLETVALYGCINLKTKGLATRHLVLCILAIVFLIPFRFYA